MNGLNFARLALLGVALTLFSSLQAQTKKELEKQRKALNEKINLTTTLISKKQESAKKEQGELVILDRQIGFRSDLISTINAEITSINRLIDQKQDSLNIKQAELEQLKEDYADLIRNAYRTRNASNKLMFVFAARSFNQAYKRISYLRQLASYRKSQSVKIVEKQKEIERDLAILDSKRDEKQILLSSQQSEKSKLISDKSRKDQAISLLKKETGKLKKSLREQERRKQEIAKEIDRIIAREINENRKKSSSGKFTLSPEAAELSANFTSNKGKLPWPVERGIVTRKFGKQPHPYVSGVYINNDGINFSAEENAAVRAVFKGEVTNVILIPGDGKVVVIKHGAYRSIYTKLKTVSVKKGETVQTKQIIGTALSIEGEKKSEIHLEIRKISENERLKLDPAQWLMGI